MTAAQLGKRLGVTQQRALAIEKAESSGSITLESLVRAANALDCRLIYAVVPRASLESLVEDRAAMLARKRLTSACHTMALEAQNVSGPDEAAQFEKLVRHLVDHSGSKLWEED
jgi:predicted DNA-binding mobile mystery protein A